MMRHRGHLSRCGCRCHLLVSTTRDALGLEPRPSPLVYDSSKGMPNRARKEVWYVQYFCWLTLLVLVLIDTRVVSVTD